MAPNGTTNQGVWSRMIYQNEYEYGFNEYWKKRKWLKFEGEISSIYSIWTRRYDDNTQKTWSSSHGHTINTQNGPLQITVEMRVNIVPKLARHEFDRRFCSRQIHHKDTVHWSVWIHLNWFVISWWYRLCMKYRGDLCGHHSRCIRIFQEQIDHIGQCANWVLNRQNNTERANAYIFLLALIAKCLCDSLINLNRFQEMNGNAGKG